jgi:16S rRNA processing protein RimM
VVGRIVRAHGVHGEVAVQVRTDDPDRRLAVGARLATDPSERGPLQVTAARWHSGRMLMRFAGLADRAGAEALRGTMLVVDVDETERPDDPDEFYDHQLVGLRAITTDGAALGVVCDVLHLPGQNLLAITRTGGSEVLVPFVAALIPDVDLARRTVTVQPPPGLLDPES